MSRISAPGRLRSRSTALILLLLAALTVTASAFIAELVVLPEEPPVRAGANAPSVRVGSPVQSPTPVCRSRVLAGAASPPVGAIVVPASRNIARATASHQPGTTFWLAPGIHHLGSGPYDNVIPKRGNTYIGAPGAVIDGRNRNLYAFTGPAGSVTISHLTIRNFGARGDNNNEGVVNHDSARGWRVFGNTIEGNAGAGLMIGSRNVVRDNCIRANGQYGFNAYHPKGVRNVTLHHNEITENNTDDWETRQPGCGCTGGGKFWETVGATITDNWIHDNRSVGLWADTNNSGFRVEGNYISNNADVGILYETSYNAAIRGNVFARNGLVVGRTSPGFPTGAIYLSESGSDRRAPGPFERRLSIARNIFYDNWSGVILWENADRFAGSPANTSSGTTTLVNPGVATESACSTPSLIDTHPYFDDCRWKTQNVLVRHNRFVFDPVRIGPECTAARDCGFNGTFSNYGTFPDWSPYQGTIVEKNVAFVQNNTFRNNRYSGPWRFMALELGNSVSWQTWRSQPFSQDSGSSLR